MQKYFFDLLKLLKNFLITKMLQINQKFFIIKKKNEFTLMVIAVLIHHLTKNMTGTEEEILEGNTLVNTKDNTTARKSDKPSTTYDHDLKESWQPESTHSEDTKLYQEKENLRSTHDENSKITGNKEASEFILPVETKDIHTTEEKTVETTTKKSKKTKGCKKITGCQDTHTTDVKQTELPHKAFYNQTLKPAIASTPNPLENGSFYLSNQSIYDSTSHSPFHLEYQNAGIGNNSTQIAFVLAVVILPIVSFFIFLVIKPLGVRKIWSKVMRRPNDGMDKQLIVNIDSEPETVDLQTFSK